MTRWLPPIVRRSLALPLAALAVLTVFVISEVTYHRSRTDLAGASAQAQIRIQVQTLHRLLVDAETGQRGYLLSGRRQYLEPYQDAVGQAEATLRTLTEHYAGDPVAAVTMKELASKSREKLSELATALAFHDEGRHEAWRELLLTDIGREKMEAVRTASEKLFELQNDRVGVLRDSLFTNFQVTRIGIDAMAALSLLALVLFLRQRAALDLAQRDLALALTRERDQLEREVARRTAELTDLARHLQTAREDERARLARELHDELGALLTSAKLDAARMRRALGTMKPEIDERLRHLNATIDQGIALKRNIIENLRPTSLANLGLIPALDILAREFAQRTDLSVRTQLSPVRLPEPLQIAVYRIVQESLTNIAKHAVATEVTVSLRADAGQAHLQVVDNGRGFDPRAARPSSHGLIGMRFRVEAGGGRLSVTSAPGQGTRVEATLPEGDAVSGSAAPSPPAAPA